MSQPPAPGPAGPNGPDGPSGDWSRRVSYADGGVVAFRPRQVMVRTQSAGQAVAILQELFGDGVTVDIVNSPVRNYSKLVGPFDVEAAVGELRAAGIVAQPNHVLFADQFSGNPFSGNPFSGNPFSGNPFSGNPFSGNPFSGNPFSGNPFSGNPFSGNPFSGNPYPGLALGNPALLRSPSATYRQSGSVRSLAQPCQPIPDGTARPKATGSPTVFVLDVPLPAPAARPWLVADCDVMGNGVRTMEVGVPDTLGPRGPGADGFLDRVAGHGMFTAGCVAQACPEAAITVVDVLRNAGDGDEEEVASALQLIEGKADIVNLSFSAYALEHMEMLASAVRRLQSTPSPASANSSVTDPTRHGAVVVSSAGNDATFVAPYPAALPGVVSVAAVGPDGPASFTNYGPWVRACAAGVDVRSGFFTFDGATPAGPDGDLDRFQGAALWSGTSFAAPLVAGKLASLVARDALLPKQAVQQLLERPDLAAIPWLGTIVTV